MAVNSKQRATNPVVLNQIDIINLHLMTQEVNGFGVVQQLLAKRKNAKNKNQSLCSGKKKEKEGLRLSAKRKNANNKKQSLCS